MNQTVMLEVFYPHSPERVWQALTDRRALAAWMMDNDFEPRLGHRFRFRQADGIGLDRYIHCEVTELEPPNRLTYRWQDLQTRTPTIVTWTLTATPGGTMLQLQHSQEVRTNVETTVSASVLLHPTVPHPKEYESPLNTVMLDSWNDRSPSLDARSTWMIESSLIAQVEWNDRLNKLSQALNSHSASESIRESLAVQPHLD